MVEVEVVVKEWVGKCRTTYMIELEYILKKNASLHLYRLPIEGCREVFHFWFLNMYVITHLEIRVHVMKIADVGRKKTLKCI